MSNNSNYFQSFFENRLYGILELDESAIVRKANKVIGNFLDSSSKSITGSSILDLLHKDEGTTFSKNHEAMMLGKVDNYELEVRFRKSSGKILHTSIAATPVFENEKKGKKVLIIVRDISRQKSNERKIQKSEEMFRLVSETTRDLICLLDSKGKYIYLSPSVKDILGFTPKELMGTSPYLLFHPQDVTRIMKESQIREQEKELRYTLEYRMRKKDDTYIWLQTITEPIKNDRGETVKIQTSSRDITEMKMAEDEVKKLLNETQLLNDRLKKNSEMLERNLDDTLVLNNELIEVKLGNNNVNFIFYKNSALLNRLIYYPYIQFSIIGLFLLIAYYMFSSSRKAEQNQVWVGMAKETAHQLGTPLSSLIAWMEYLRSKDIEESTISEISKDLARLEMITERFSKIGSKAKLEDENLVECAEEIIGYLKRRISDNVEFTVLSEPKGPIYAKLNPALFGWVMENIIKNAVDAMEGQGRVTVKIQDQERRVIMDIMDTGKGIRKQDRKTVFEPGFTTKKRGWGLGLSLVKRIVENYHNGKVFVKDTDKSIGTTFRIILPK